MTTTTVLPTRQQIAVRDALSHPRLSTFEAVTTAYPVVSGAVELYAWNAQVSGALLTPLHICEVVIRNAVSDALTRVYGHQWPWLAGFVNSLPNSGKWKMRDYLCAVTRRYPAATTSTGKLIAELSPNFWEKMFTGRFDAMVWNPHLFTVFPYLNSSLGVQHERAVIFGKLNKIRALRNRVAHHEYIFSRNIFSDFQDMQDLIACRCDETAKWVYRNQQVVSLLSQRPR